MSKILLSLLLILLSIQSIAQPAKELAKYQQKYPGAAAVRLEESVVLHFEIVNAELYIYENKYEETLFLHELASYLKEGEVSHSSFNEIENIRAYSEIPGNKKYKRIDVEEFKQKDDLSSSIFHDDIRYTTFSYDGLQKGAKTTLAYRNIYKEEHLIGKEFLQSFIPIEHKKYTIIADEAIEIGLSSFNLDQVDFTFSERNADGKNYYTWEVKDVKEIKSENWSPDIAWYSAHVIPYVKSYTIDGKTTNIFRDKNDLFTWYNSLIKDLNTETNNPEIQTLVDSITKGAVDELDIVRKVFYWVQDNIKYIAIEYGMGGFIPRETSDICTNRYGDCKDMATTITELLSYAGVESYITWIGTNKIPYTYDEVPSPVVNNHMIATYIDSVGNYYFLDATGRYYSFGIPSAFIQGKEALIKKGPTEYEIVEVPFIDPEDNKISEKVHLKIEGNHIKGNALTRISGYQKANLEYEIENLSKEDKVTFYKAYLSKGSNKFIPENFSEKNAYPIENPLELAYDFTIDNYVINNGDESYINMNLENTMLGQKIEKNREVPIQNKYAVSFVNDYILEIPNGWSVDYIPEDLVIKNDFLQYKSNYELKDNELILRQYTNISFINMDKSHFEEWNKHVNQIKKNQNEIVIIKQNHD